MKFYLKIFIISLAIFSIILGGAYYMIIGNAQKKPPEEIETPVIVIGEDQEEDPPVEEKTELEKLIEASDRVNVVVFGIDGGRADTIMLVSYCPSDQLVDILSIPRDTYNPDSNHDNLGQKKINAVYGFKDNGGSLGIKNAIGQLLDIPINHYVKVNYNGVEDIIDVLGGVEINVFKDLDYDDPDARPPLHIHIPKGRQVLNGKTAVEYLRWRKNNGEEGSDLERIKRQQEFLVVAAKKAFSFKLPVVIKTTFNYVKTDMGLDTMLYYGTTAVGFDFSNVKKYSLPGEVKNISGVSFVIHDPAETEKLLIDIYNRTPEVAQ
jgi:LCP family protein required for cell wall assembly